MVMSRTLVCGDIHGGLKALHQVIDRCNVKFTEDRLIFLGDYVDGWTESAEVIDFLINLQKIMGDRVIFIEGNHDIWCKDWLNKGAIHPYWLNNGGEVTKDSYLRNPNFLTSNEHKKFFRTLHPYYIDGQNRGYVHGGFTSRKGLGHEKYQGVYSWDRDFWNLCMLSHGRVHEGGTDSVRRFEKHKEIFIGHTSTTFWKCKPHYPEYQNDRQKSKSGPITVPMNRCNVWNLDTGAGWDGKLTIMDVDTKEFWQSDFVEDLYPNEKGRKG